MAAHEQVQVPFEAILPSQQTLSSMSNNKEAPINPQPDALLEDDAHMPFSYSDATRIAWNWVCWSGAKTFDGMEFAGEVIADFLGLTQSKYQWILDAREREEEEIQLRRLEARQRRQLHLEQLVKEEQRKLHELEIGALEENTEPTHLPVSCTV